MKAILVNDVLNLPLNSMRSAFPKKNGSYLVDDGVAYSIVNVESHMDDLMIPYGTPIPRECTIKEYERIGERDIDLLQKQLSELSYMIKNNTSDQFDMFNKVLDNLKEGGNGGQVDIADLTKMIAVAQKPELLDKKVK